LYFKYINYTANSSKATVKMFLLQETVVSYLRSNINWQN